MTWCQTGARRRHKTPGRSHDVVKGAHGTHWAERLMRLYPDTPDGVFLEALVPGDYSYRGFDYSMNRVGMQLMQECADSPDCRRRFDDDPVAVARDLPARLRAGHCGSLDFSVPVSWVLGSMLYDHGLRNLAPLLVRMLDRCNADDVTRLRRMYAALFADNGMLIAGDFSAPAYIHVILTDLWQDDLPEGTSVEQVSATCMFCPSDRAALDHALSTWPGYDVDPLPPPGYYGSLWMLQGELDPGVTPDMAKSMAHDYRGEHQHFISFPAGSHTLVGKTPTKDGDCALQLLSAMLRDPLAEPPADCAANVLGRRLDLGPNRLTEALLGAGDPTAPTD